MCKKWKANGKPFPCQEATSAVTLENYSRPSCSLHVPKSLLLALTPAPFYTEVLKFRRGHPAFLFSRILGNSTSWTLLRFAYQSQDPQPAVLKGFLPGPRDSGRLSKSHTGIKKRMKVKKEKERKERMKKRTVKKAFCERGPEWQLSLKSYFFQIWKPNKIFLRSLSLFLFLLKKIMSGFCLASALSVINLNTSLWIAFTKPSNHVTSIR